MFMLEMLGNLALGVIGIVVFVRGFGFVTKIVNFGFDKLEGWMKPKDK